jgi:hypothetical protein
VTRLEDSKVRVEKKTPKILKGSNVSNPRRLTGTMLG